MCFHHAVKVLQGKFTASDSVKSENIYRNFANYLLDNEHSGIDWIRRGLELCSPSWRLFAVFPPAPLISPPIPPHRPPAEDNARLLCSPGAVAWILVLLRMSLCLCVLLRMLLHCMVLLWLSPALPSLAGEFPLPIHPCWWHSAAPLLSWGYRSTSRLGWGRHSPPLFG